MIYAVLSPIKLFCLRWVPIGSLFHKNVGSLFLSSEVPISFRSSAYRSHCMLQQYCPWFETNAWFRVPLAHPAKSRASVCVSVRKNHLKVFCLCNLIIIMENFILAGPVRQRQSNGQTTPERGEMLVITSFQVTYCLLKEAKNGQKIDL